LSTHGNSFDLGSGGAEGSFNYLWSITDVLHLKVHVAEMRLFLSVQVDVTISLVRAVRELTDELWKVTSSDKGFCSSLEQV
jgi:hypothetical protein